MKNPTLNNAIALAKEAHAGQTDKAGAPYYGHLERVMNSVEGDELKMVAVLHDSIEDTFVTPEYLRKSGYPDHLIEAIEALTKLTEEECSDDGYERFILRAAHNPLARIVKMADLRDNMDLSRLAEETDKDHERKAKYQRALDRLESMS